MNFLGVKMMKKKIYLSMPYRGSLGDSASDEDIAVNIERAVAMAGEVKKHFPCIDVFVPHIDTGVLHNDWRAGKITSEEILNKCCENVENCDILISIGSISSGMELEINTALAKPIPVLIFDDFNLAEQQELADALKELGVFDENLS
jgi:flagellar biosynthesis/type III secretory pathway ATPase